MHRVTAFPPLHRVTASRCIYCGGSPKFACREANAAGVRYCKEEPTRQEVQELHRRESPGRPTDQPDQTRPDQTEKTPKKRTTEEIGPTTIFPLNHSLLFRLAIVNATKPTKMQRFEFKAMP